MKFFIAIISKDRTNYLENLLNTFTNYFPKKIYYEIHLFDNSLKRNEINKIKLLKNTYKYKIHNNLEKVNNKSGLGNLYLKMNQALDLSLKNNFDYLFFIQDDMQFVRKINKNEIERALNVFNDELCFHLACHFHKGFELNYEKKFYYSKKYECYKNNFSSCSDIGIYDLKKIKNINFYFKNEDTNDRKYFKLNYRSYHLFNPWYHFTPWPVSSRRFENINNFFLIKLTRNLLIFLNIIGTSSGLNKFKEMDSLKINEMFNRDKNQLPTAEHFLTTFKKLKKPWAHDIIWDFRKYKKIKNIILLKWIFDGSLDYINNRKILKKNNLLKSYKRKLKS